MTAFDRLAWRCSFIAPAAFLAAVAAVFLNWAGVARAGPNAAQAYLAIAALTLAFLGLAAHMVVQYHAVKPGTLPSGTDRSRLELSLRFGMGYGKWRQLMRAKHQELRTRAGQHD